VITPYHAKYFAYELTKRCPTDSIQKLVGALSDAQVDLNPHQVEAALFAFRSPLSKGAILADEVGLGKTIEAGILISQKWAERKRKILIMVPSNLRKQWNQELLDKFFLPSEILESLNFNREVKKGSLNPFRKKKIVICSLHFAKAKEDYIRQVDWDLVVIDEAHRLRNVYKPTNKIGNAIKRATEHVPKVLLTATPLQNSLLELFGLVSLIDDYAFGDRKSFTSQYARLTNDDNYDDLKQRLQPICKRTLRRQVLEYIKYTNRIPITQEFIPTEDEQKLYNLVSDYLQSDTLFALPASQRHLMTLILRKLLASSTYAISGTLETLANKLEAVITAQQLPADIAPEVSEDYESFDETADEWSEDDSESEDQKTWTQDELEHMKQEIQSLRFFQKLADSIKKNSKGQVLMTALKKGFAKLEELGANKKAIIFTESRRTQNYLKEILEQTAYAGKIVLFNGSNSDPKSKEIYKAWLDKYKGTDRVTGSRTSDLRAAIVDYFKNEAIVMIATEAGAEGVNLQFCSLVVNYDLPWNPQRIEQRIGRCHRYGQEFDVVVVNFLNRKNAADQRVYELLSEKFKLFSGVFGASDEVLGSIESGVDFEKRIAQIYQSCRTSDEIQLSFDFLQKELEIEISKNIKTTRQKLLENFDEEVHEKLKINLKESREYLGKYENWFWQLTRYFLEPYARFDGGSYSFYLVENPFPNEKVHPGPYRIGKNIEDANIYRIGHPLAQRIINHCKSESLPFSELVLDYTNTPTKITILESLIGKSGWLTVTSITISSFETEDYLIPSAICDDGTVIDPEQCHRMFSLNGQAQQTDASYSGKHESVNKLLRDQFERERNKIISDISTKNAQYFELELDKLDKWGDDKRISLKVALKELDDQIKELKKEARIAPNLPEKLEIQKKIRDLSKKRDTAWKEYDESAHEVEKQKDALIDEIEARMSQKVKEEQLFTVRWKLI